MCHYPTGCSKWNPIGHRLFSQISLNWAGVPLRSFETATRYIEGTETATGLRVKAVRVSEEAMRRLRIEPHAVCQAWNDTLHPRTDQARNDQIIS